MATLKTLYSHNLHHEVKQLRFEMMVNMRLRSGDVGE